MVRFLIFGFLLTVALLARHTAAESQVHVPTKCNPVKPRLPVLPANSEDGIGPQPPEALATFQPNDPSEVIFHQPKEPVSLWAYPAGPAKRFIMDLKRQFDKEAASTLFTHRLAGLAIIIVGLLFFVDCCAAAGRSLRRTYSSYLLGGAFALAAIVLWVHHHLAYAHRESVILQHRFMAGTALLIAAAALLENWDGLSWKGKSWLVPSGPMLMSMQLILYRE